MGRRVWLSTHSRPHSSRRPRRNSTRTTAESEPHHPEHEELPWFLSRSLREPQTSKSQRLRDLETEHKPDRAQSRPRLRVGSRPRPRHGGPATEPPPCTLLRHADLAGRGLCCSRGLGCPPPPSSTWLSTPYSLRPMAKFLLRDTPAPQAQRSQALLCYRSTWRIFLFLSIHSI